MKRFPPLFFALWLGALWARAEEPVAGTGLGLESPPAAAPKKPKEPSRGWRGPGRPSEAAKKLPKKEPGAASRDERPKFAPGKAPAASPAEKPAASESVNNEEDQWRRSPPDRRWESWREFPVEKQVDLWRKLSFEERQAYWDRMNVHERATLWLKMDVSEKETHWGGMPEPEKRALCAAFPPKEKALWQPRLAVQADEPAGQASPAKFRPATPTPGFQPKSSYKEEDD